MRCLVIQTAFLGDEIISYDKRGSEGGVAPLLGLVARLRSLGIDAALLPHRSFRSALIAWLSRIPKRVGFDESGGALLLTDTIRYRSHAHEIERVASLAEGIGVPLPVDGLPFELGVPEAALADLSADLAERGVEREAALIAVAPGSKWPTKRWPEERFAAAADALAGMLGAGVVLLGSSDDCPVCRRVSEMMVRDAIELCGPLSLGGTLALASRSLLVLSNDSAAAHIAAGVGTPVVAVFGPTVQAQGFAPYSRRSRVVEADLACRPCGRHGGERCRRGDHACMSSIEVEEVLRAAGDLLSSHGGPA
jgi:heptosyltransferase-2